MKFGVYLVHAQSGIYRGWGASRLKRKRTCAKTSESLKWEPNAWLAFSRQKCMASHKETLSLSYLPREQA